MKGKMGSFVILVLVAAIMGLFALNVYQGYKYERLQAEVNEYQNTQEQWFEKNKQELTSLSAYSSPQHVKEVKETMKLSNAKVGQTIIIDTRSQIGSDAELRQLVASCCLLGRGHILQVHAQTHGWPVQVPSSSH